MQEIKKIPRRRGIKKTKHPLKWGAFKKWAKAIKKYCFPFYALTDMDTIIPMSTTNDKMANCLNRGFIFEAGL